ncbi:hypothetical protein B0T21DRAFT_361918 [Apiosordaria backusii]|uniref:Uncharacterized protein n=1 Tax=Apiosordaria backusii TaxID=314023 RepID=A0AA40BRQ4_9PEZI|nr:hypothetical protein B0T21DRAFT_361918 [Apiosordaria backusii]
MDLRWVLFWEVLVDEKNRKLILSLLCMWCSSVYASHSFCKVVVVIEGWEEGGVGCLVNGCFGDVNNTGSMV